MERAPPTEASTAELDRAVRALERPDPNLLWLYLAYSLAGLALAPVVFVPLYFKYHTLRYRLDEQGIAASWGILFRREVHLTYRRIQDIHVRRNLLERWLGIATVEVETAAGSSSAELALEGMRGWEAVRDFLYRKMRGHEPEGDAAAAGAPPAGPGARGAGASEPDEAVRLLREIRGELEAARRALEARA